MPTELLPAFQRNPAAVARLLNSWEYVNQAPFSAAPNIRDFLRGDKANWGLIAKKIAFERDLEDEVYDTLLDYATSPTKRPTTKLVLAPAGYGTTTFLRTLAERLVGDRAGIVFLHREGTPLMQGDIEFATSLSTECPFFLVDNAADHEEAIYEALQHLRDISKPALFLLGERLNEWRYTRHGRSSGQEFVIEPLSDPEITRLLDCLEANNELNVLADLSHEFRIAAIKQNYQQELLVTLREATEGRAFDAILEDEFRSIPTELGRRLYLIVCCFYQDGAMVRDSLIAEILALNVAAMYSDTSEATQGVVIYEEIDPAYGHFAARARHRKIATVVWERCAEPSQREQIILSALSRINLNYRTDVKAFENFIRSDRLVDSIRTFDDRVSFFEQACQKDPTSPYVRQHYARMLARSNHASLALGQIDEGLKLNSQLRVLHHTKGVVLQQLAMTTESREIARRRLAQSEEEFHHCLKANIKDEYSYQGLATLYVEWAERSPDPAEVTDYLAKAEAVINDGLRHVRVRDGLWIVSSRIQNLLGNTPAYMQALVKAATGASTSIVAKYLLGRAYRNGGEPQKTIDLLRPVIEAHTDEFRVIAMQPPGREHMRFNTPEDRFQHRAAGPHLVGQGRQAQRHAFLGVAFGLAVERLMLPELLEQDHRQKTGTGPAPGDHMERRRSLADLLAVPAGKLLADMLDHLPLARDRFQRLGDGLPQLAQPPAAAAKASSRSRHDHPLARQMFGERLARRALAGEGRHRSGLGHRYLGRDLVLGGRTL